MRLSSKDLHKLVHTFSTNEKMLFKRFNKPAGKAAAFIILFDVLAAMKTYDEQQLVAKLQKKGVDSYLKSLKTYLYDRLLDYLRVNPGINTKRWKMRQMNIEADLLLERGLRRNALELYNEQFAVAKTVMNPHHELTALDNYISYASRTFDTPMLREYEDILTEKMAAFHNLLLAQNEFRKIGLFYFDKFPIRNSEAINELDKIAQAPIMQQQANMLSPLANIFYFNFHSYICILRNDHQGAYKYALQRYKYQSALSRMPDGMNGHRLTGIELLIRAAVKSNRIEEATGYYSEVIQLANLQKDFRAQLLKHSCFAYLNSFTDWDESNEIDRAGAFAFLEQHKSESTVVASTMMSLANAYFRCKGYEQTLTLLNYVITEKFSFQQSVLQTEARMLAIITHYELKNYRLISYMVTNARRYLKQEHKLFPLENALLNGISHLPEKINASDMQRALQKLKENLEKILENPLEREAMTGFDFVGWINSKLQLK